MRGLVGIGGILALATLGLVGLSEAQEGLSAFLEKRKASWIGVAGETKKKPAKR